MLNIEQPGVDGINIHDLEYELPTSQSPKMLNMIYRNGTFGKRYGQEVASTFDYSINAMAVYQGHIVVHSRTSFYVDGERLETSAGVRNQKGTFFNFNNKLWYMLPYRESDSSGARFYVYDGVTLDYVSPTVPVIAINVKPDLSYYDTVQDYNLLSSKFIMKYHGDGSTKAFKLLRPCSSITVTVDNVETTAYTLNGSTITFTTAPSAGTNNVEVTGTMSSTEYQTYAKDILGCKYHCNFGGNNKSRMFLAGNGTAKYYYSDVFDCTYFPESNYGILGNTEEDITGLAVQYNIMVAFKPNEMYSFSYYTQSSNTTTDESEYGVGAFSTAIINDQVGCDVPNSIQLVDNQLTWLSTRKGVQTLASTSILDERNVRSVGRNIEGGFRSNGILEEANLQNAVAVDYDKKYILSVNGRAYVWDYNHSRYYNTGKQENDAKRCSWFLWDNWYPEQYIMVDNELYFSKGNTIVHVNQNIFNDFGDPIHAIYQTPLFQFDAQAYLKTIKNMYVQVRGDVASTINVRYITEDNPDGEVEPEPILIESLNRWDGFRWDKFVWSSTAFGNTFRRKCQLKKVQMAAFLFENNEVDKDMSLSHLSIQYFIVKEVK